jgi:hypothetical protein
MRAATRERMSSIMALVLAISIGFLMYFRIARDPDTIAEVTKRRASPV